jgi:uncharacterized protein (TIGR02594 family)
MKYYLLAGTMAYGLVCTTTPAEAGGHRPQHWGHQDRNSHLAVQPSVQLQSCDDSRCFTSVAPTAAAAPSRRALIATTAVVASRPVAVSTTSFEGAPSTDPLVRLAQSQLGSGAIYGRATLWCGRFMNWTLTHAGYRGTGSDLALSFLSFPRTTAHVGAIAVFGRGKNAGHVGIVAGFDPQGNPIVISGNHSHRVGRGVYPRGRVIAYVSPK